MNVEFKKIDLTNKAFFDNANPIMLSAINGFNNTFSLMKKLGEGLEKDNIRTVVLLFDKTKPRNDIKNPPFEIYCTVDDLVQRIKQLEYLLSKKNK